MLAQWSNCATWMMPQEWLHTSPGNQSIREFEMAFHSSPPITLFCTWRTVSPGHFMICTHSSSLWNAVSEAIYFFLSTLLMSILWCVASSHPQTTAKDEPCPWSSQTHSLLNSAVASSALWCFVLPMINNGLESHAAPFHPTRRQPRHVDIVGQQQCIILDDLF